MNSKNRAILNTILILFSSAVLYIISRYNYALFHSFADIIVIFIAASVFVIIWTGRHLLDNQYYLCISIGFLFFAFFDFLHLLGNKGMGVFPQFGNMGPAFYIIGRYILSISFLAAPLFIKRKVRIPILFVIYSAVSILILLSVFYWRNFPVAYIEGTGLTPFKVVSDYVIDFFFLGAIGLLLQNRRSFDPKVFKFILLSLILSIATGLVFTLYSDPFGITNVAGHFLQIASFYVVYMTFVETGLAKPQNLLFRNLTQSNEEIQRLNSELQKANSDLNYIINARKKAEDELKRYAAELETSNKELEAFAYSLSHDLRAPLRALDGFSQAILEDYTDLLDAVGRDYLMRIRGAAQSMAQITEGMLKLSEVIRFELCWETDSLSDIVTSIAKDLMEKDPERKVEFVIAPGVFSCCDPSLLRIALYNLMENAWKFTAKSPQARIEFASMEEEGVTIYFVRDNGIGFDMRYADNLFQPFQRLHASDFDGYGIGLATVQRVVHRHGGRIWAESEPGMGATFYFTLCEFGIQP